MSCFFHSFHSFSIIFHRFSNSYVGTPGIPTIPVVAEVPQGGTNVEGPPDLLNALAKLMPQRVPSEAPGTCAEDPPVLSEKSKDSPGVLPVATSCDF